VHEPVPLAHWHTKSPQGGTLSPWQPWEQGLLMEPVVPHFPAAVLLSAESSTIKAGAVYMLKRAIFFRAARLSTFSSRAESLDSTTLFSLSIILPFHKVLSDRSLVNPGIFKDRIPNIPCRLSYYSIKHCRIDLLVNPSHIQGQDTKEGNVMQLLPVAVSLE
jgi:hypothetical protein